MAIEHEIMTVEEVAEYLHAHPVTVQRALRNRQLPGNKIGRAWRIRRQDLIEYLSGEEPDLKKAILESRPFRRSIQRSD